MSYFEDLIDRSTRQLGIAQVSNLNQLGPTTTVRADATLTASYVDSSSVDLNSYRQVSIRVLVGTAQATRQAKVKVQWSHDNVTFVDDQVLANKNPSGTEVRQDIYSLVKLVELATAGNYWDGVFDRKARYVRVTISSDSGVTTGTVSATVTPMNR